MKFARQGGMHVAAPRLSLVAVLAVFSACGGEGAGPNGPAQPETPGPVAETPAPPRDPGTSTPLAAPAQGYQLLTPDVTIGPGEEKYYCYYTSLPFAKEVGVRRFQSQMTPGSHHMILYATKTKQKEDGTVVECGGGMGTAPTPGGVAVWTYAAQTPEAQLNAPEGVGLVFGERQSVIVNMHYLNVTSEPIHAHVAINMETFAENESYTPAAAFATFNTKINVPPNGTQSVESSCAVPADAKFFGLSTHSHKFTTHATVKDGDRAVLVTEDWEHPTAKAFQGPDFLQFSSGKMTYGCTYSNPTSAPVKVGDSADTDEMCMAIGYFFPARSMTFCVNDFILSR